MAYMPKCYKTAKNLPTFFQNFIFPAATHRIRISEHPYRFTPHGFRAMNPFYGLHPEESRNAKKLTKYFQMPAFLCFPNQERSRKVVLFPLSPGGWSRN
jgi:hypothetical protein